MDVLTFETCWAVNSEIVKQVTSSWSIIIQPPLLFFICSSNRNSCISQHMTFRPVFFSFITSWRQNVAHCTCLSSVALQLLLSHLTAARDNYQWTWRSHRREGIPRLDEPLSASQERVLQQSLLQTALFFLDRAIAVFVCQPLGRTRHMVAHNRNTKCGFRFTC